MSSVKFDVKCEIGFDRRRHCEQTCFLFALIEFLKIEKITRKDNFQNNFQEILELFIDGMSRRMPRNRECSPMGPHLTQYRMFQSMLDDFTAKEAGANASKAEVSNVKENAAADGWEDINGRQKEEEDKNKERKTEPEVDIAKEMPQRARRSVRIASLGPVSYFGADSNCARPVKAVDGDFVGFTKTAVTKAKPKVSELKKAMKSAQEKNQPTVAPNSGILKPDYSRLAIRNQPPFVCLGDEAIFMRTWKSLKAENELKFTVKKINEGFRVYPQNLDSKDRINDKLNEMNVEHFSYSDKGTRIRRILARGFPAEWSEITIIEKLKALGLKEVDWIKVSRMSTKAATALGCESNLFKINFVSRKGAGEPLKVKVVDGLRVFFEIFKTRKQEIAQCWRCQRMGHISKHCQMKKRCIKCGAPHFKLDCPVTRAGGTRFLKCCLCGGAHPANARKCTVRKAAAEAVTRKQEIISKHSKSNRGSVNLGPSVPLQTPLVGIGLSNDILPVIPASTINQQRTDVEHPPLRQLDQPGSENPLDKTAFEIFGQTWKTVVVAIYQFEKQFGCAPEYERKRLMIDFISGGFAKRLAEATIA